MTDMITPGPWALPLSDDGVWEGDILSVPTGDVVAEGTTAADAAFILLAVNSFDDLVAALEAAIPRLCWPCELKLPFTPAFYEPVGAGNMIRGVGESDSHIHPRYGFIACEATQARAALTKAKGQP